MTAFFRFNFINTTQSIKNILEDDTNGQGSKIIVLSKAKYVARGCINIHLYAVRCMKAIVISMEGLCKYREFDQRVVVGC